MRFFRKKNQPGGGPPGGRLHDREIPRPPHAPLPPIHAWRRAAGAGCFCACGGRGLNGSMMDPAAAAEGKTRFSRKFLDARRGEGGGSCFYACDARGWRLYAPSCRFHKGSGAGRRGAKSILSRSGCRICRDPPASLPPGGKFPMPQKRARRARRNSGCGTGERAIGDQMEGRGSGGASAIVRLRPRLRMPMRMRGTRHARYLQTLP